MRATLILGALALILSVPAFVGAQEEEEDLAPGNLVIVSSKENKTPLTIHQGDLLQINFSYPVTPDGTLEDLKAESSSKALSKLGILRVPNKGPDGKPIVGSGILGAFFVADEVGNAKLKISPVSKGKKGAPVEFTVKIVAAMQ